MPSPRTPALGLLLDVDGPIASPVSRAVSRPSIVPDLVALLAAGVPVVFNTGRSDAFLRRQVIAPLVQAGIPEGARLHGVCEKGAVWFGIGQHGAGRIEVDASLSTPKEYGRAVAAIVRERYADTMFLDATKRAMVSVEQRVDVPAATYLAVRDAFDREALAAFGALGLGARLHEREVPDAQGRVGYRVDPTIISTDLESVVLGKDHGAQKAWELLAADGPMPRAWRTVGDSRTDYRMADWLHGRGEDVVHVDVRPADGLLERDYPVLTPTRSVNDEAGAAYLRRVLALVRGERTDETGFDALS